MPNGLGRNGQRLSRLQEERPEGQSRLDVPPRSKEDNVADMGSGQTKSAAKLRRCLRHRAVGLKERRKGFSDLAYLGRDDLMARVVVPAHRRTIPVPVAHVLSLGCPIEVAERIIAFSRRPVAGLHSRRSEPNKSFEHESCDLHLADLSAAPHVHNPVPTVVRKRMDGSRCLGRLGVKVSAECAPNVSVLVN